LCVFSTGCVDNGIVQAQALIVGLLAALFSIVLGWVPEGKFSIIHALLLGASSVLTAGIASFVLGMTTAHTVGTVFLRTAPWYIRLI